MGRCVGGAEGSSARLRTPASAHPPAPQTQLCLSATVLCSIISYFLTGCGGGRRARAARYSPGRWALRWGIRRYIGAGVVMKTVLCGHFRFLPSGREVKAPIFPNLLALWKSSALRYYADLRGYRKEFHSTRR